ncbi:MAG: hypothetical protein LBC70_09070 [Chitinispirillales bacterium]|nr:hypothetical protein [Chitinispirillales bacterium]
MELVRGTRSKNVVFFIQKVFKNVTGIVYIDENFSQTTEHLVITYAQNHNPEIDNALMAATAWSLTDRNGRPISEKHVSESGGQSLSMTRKSACR